MYELMVAEVVALALVVSAVTAAVVLSVLRILPRALQTIVARVTCPLLGRRVTAELMRDLWTLRFTDVRRCSVLGADVGLCRKACLVAGRVEGARHPRGFTLLRRQVRRLLVA